ncbi:MAG: class I SAM-dependent methyltransferase [Sedimentisphaeraceae bacterium JB056]
MAKIKEIIKFPFKPYWKIKRIIKNRYNPEKYWENRHRKYSDNSLKGVGHIKKTEEANIIDYNNAANVFLELCKENNIDFSNKSVLEIGCGNGFYTNIVHQHGCKDYIGIDIAEYPLKKLENKFCSYHFKKLDITKRKLNQRFDLIIMIDVTQHITKDKLFVAAMENIQEMLSDKATFIVTEWLSEAKKQRQYYEVERPLEYYQNCFKGFKISNPKKFRDKYIFSIKK